MSSVNHEFCEIVLVKEKEEHVEVSIKKNNEIVRSNIKVGVNDEIFDEVISCIRNRRVVDVEFDSMFSYSITQIDRSSVFVHTTNVRKSAYKDYHLIGVEFYGKYNLITKSDKYEDNSDYSMSDMIFFKKDDNYIVI